MLSQAQLDLVWNAVSTGTNALVIFSAAQDQQSLEKEAKQLLGFLRPCGVLEETPDFMHLKNDTWVLCKKAIPIDPRAMDRMKQDGLEIFVV